MDNTHAPLVSIVIATYNVQNYIERCLHSALNQIGLNVEVIMVDDASTDNTVKVARNIKDERLHIITQAINSGPSVARNIGLSMASAPWIAVLDGDDAYDPHRLSRCLQQATVMQADAVVDNIEMQYEDDRARSIMFETKDFGKKSSLDLETFIKGNSSFLGGTSLGYLKPIFSSAFLNRYKLRYDPNIRIGEDYILLAEVLANDGLCAIEKSAGYVYTVRKGSISHRLSLMDIELIRKGDEKFLAKYKLSVASQRAQLYRQMKLGNVYSYISVTDAIKQKRFLTAFFATIANPLVLFNLMKLVWWRIKRICSHLFKVSQ